MGIWSAITYGDARALAAFHRLHRQRDEARELYEQADDLFMRLNQMHYKIAARRALYPSQRTDVDPRMERLSRLILKAERRTARRLKALHSC